GHKTAKHGKERVILLSGAALDIVKRLVAEYPAGPMFRAVEKKRKGKQPAPWTDKTITSIFHRIRTKLDLPNFTPYRYRHTFATAFLEKGGSVDVLAALLGNSPEVIRRHYSHLLGDTANLRRQLEAFRGSGNVDIQDPASGGAA